VRYWRALARLRYRAGLENSAPSLVESLERVSIGVAIGLQFNMLARSKISRAYCCCNRKSPEAFRWTFTLRKWCNSPRSDMENSLCKEEMMERSNEVVLAVKMMSST
jgi:hypothetical protein